MRITRIPLRRRYFGALLCSVWVAACGPSSDLESSGGKAPVLGSQGQDVIYGEDHRTDVYAYTAHDELVERARKSTVAMMYPSSLVTTDPENVTFNAPSLQSYFNLCSSQRFLADPTPGLCSGTLIDDDLVLTAGHCISSADCAGLRFVFNFYRTSATELQTVTTRDIFACQAVVARQQATVNGRNLDYAIVRLDRSAVAEGFEPAPIRPGNEALPQNTSVTVIGSGSGIPFKIDDGGWVRDARAGTLDYFVANTDTFGGNSGSGVYENDNFTVAGILVRGETDYVAQGSCRVVNQCSDTGCRGEDITYVRPAVDAYCAANGSVRLCGRAEPPPPPPPPPAAPSNPFAYAATATNGAQTNTTNYSIELKAGQTITIGTCGLDDATFTGDTYLRLRDAYNSEVAFSDDGCTTGYGSRIVYTAAAAGPYIIVPGCYSSGSCTGHVAWTITGGEPEPDPTQGSFGFSAEETNSARQNTVDQFVAVTTGQRLTATTCGSADGDTFLRLYNGTRQVASNDDGCDSGRGSTLSFTASTSSLLQIRAGCYLNTSCGGSVTWFIE